MKHLEEQGYFFTEDKEVLKAEALMPLYKDLYWAKDRPLETVRKSLEHSYCCGIMKDGTPIAMMRLVTDYATFAYVSDVTVAKEHRGKGLSKMMLKNALERPDIAHLRRWCLMTKDAHGLYEQFGFQVSSTPERFMEVIRE